MSKFSKQHYELIAKILRTQLDNRTRIFGYVKADTDRWAELYALAAARISIKDIATDFHNVFRLDNDRYDAERYFLACGMDDWKDITEPTEHDVQPYSLIRSQLKFLDETPDFYGEQG